MNFIEILKSKHVRKPVILAWCIAFVISATVPSITGQIYGAEEAKDLLESVQKSSLYYGSAILTASATVLALMLTLLSLTSGKGVKTDEQTFTKMHAISMFCVYSFVGAIVLLVVISFPVIEFEAIPSAWFKFVYYGLCCWNGMLAGFMISTILILRDAVRFMIGAVSPDFDEEGKKEDEE